MPASRQIHSDNLETTEVQRLTLALAAAERERQLYACEIHDGVVQDLSAAALYLESAAREAEFASPEMREKLALGLRLLRDSIAELRRLIRGNAVVEFGEQGLADAVLRLIEKFRADHGLAIECSLTATLPPYPPSTQHLLLRIIQEALFNIWKHAAANHVQVQLTMAGNRLVLTIADDGIGFDPAQVSAGHFGLAGMRARARALGADLQIDSRAGQGTLITVTLPKQHSTS